MNKYLRNELKRTGMEKRFLVAFYENYPPVLAEGAVSKEFKTGNIIRFICDDNYSICNSNNEDHYNLFRIHYKNKDTRINTIITSHNEKLLPIEFTEEDAELWFKLNY